MSQQKRLLLVFLLFSLALAGTAAQEGGKNKGLTFGPPDKPKQLLPFPLFIQNPTMGSGFGLAVTLMFKTDYEDPDSPYSLVSVPGFYTNTKSYFLGSFTRLYLNQDKLRITAGGGYGRVNNNFEYQEGILNQEIKYYMAQMEALYSFWPGIYVGGGYFFSYLDYIKFHLDGVPQPIDNTTNSGINLVAQWDSRDNVYNPSRGIYSTIEPEFFPTWLGSSASYISLSYDFNWYQTLIPQFIFAYRLAGYHAFGKDPPYSALPTLGRGADLRGYETGQYRGSNLFTTQGELRWNFAWKLSLTAFGGVGVFYGTDESTLYGSSVDGQLFPSAGFGLAFLTSEETGMTIRVDLAWGRYGEFAWYFKMGNSF